MGNLHVVLGALAKRVGQLEASAFTPELAAEVARELQALGAVKPGRTPPSVEEIQAIFETSRSQFEVQADFDRRRIAKESERRVDFEQRPFGRGALAQLMAMKDGPVTPIGEASVFADPYANHHSYVIDTGGYRWELPASSSGLGPFVRSVDDPITDAAYVKVMVENAAASIRNVFEPALLDGSLFREFPRVLEAQHEALARGPGGEYQGGTCARATITPGFVHQRALAFGADPNKPRGGLKIGLFPEHLRPKEGPLRVEGFAPDEWPVVTSRIVQFMPLAAMDRVVARMGELLRMSLEHLDTPIGLQHAADYFHLATQSHLFDRGNNTLFMTHLNYVLERRGLLPIAHGNLDFEAYGSSYDDFRPKLYAAIAEKNPGLTIPAAGTSR